MTSLSNTKIFKAFQSWLCLSTTGSRGLVVHLFFCTTPFFADSLTEYSFIFKFSFIHTTQYQYPHFTETFWNKRSKNHCTFLCSFVCLLSSMRITKHSESQLGFPSFSFSGVCKNWTTFLSLEEKMTIKMCFYKK